MRRRARREASASTRWSCSVAAASSEWHARLRNSADPIFGSLAVEGAVVGDSP